MIKLSIRVMWVWTLVLGTAGAWPLRGSHEIIIHEVAWMGTRASPEQLWVELYNPGSSVVSLDGWKLRCREQAFVAALSGTIQPGDSFVLIHESNPELWGVPIGGTFSDVWCAERPRLMLVNDADQLIDVVDQWHAGDLETFATMQRNYPYRAGYSRSSWRTSTIRYEGGYGSPGFRDTSAATGQMLHQVYHGPDAINVYFNHEALTEFASPGNKANHRVNLEERILSRMRQATNTIDITVYELNLPNMTDLLIRKAAEGVRVRLIADSKEPHPDDAERVARWEDARMHLERLIRGADGVPGTADDVIVFANAPIFAFDADPRRRRAMGLPSEPRDFPRVSIISGGQVVRGRKLVTGEQREDESFFRPGAQMHNKFIVIDGRWVWTGSMNFTLTDLFGSKENQRRGLLEGNTNNGLEIHSPELAAVFTAEFEQMWGGDGDKPTPHKARFSHRKATQDNPHGVQVGDRHIDVYFSPGYDVIPAMARVVADEARERLYFAIFAWSDFDLEQAIKKKWEGDKGYQEGERTGFELRGVFEFWNEWWSAAINMTGRIPDTTSEINPNVRWRYAPSVFRQNEARRLHHKYMIIDANTSYNPLVITGSANWSNNANRINDENSLFIYCPIIANQFAQEFYAVYHRAGGDPWRPLSF